jgi:hypothetical protein
MVFCFIYYSFYIVVFSRLDYEMNERDKFEAWWNSVDDGYVDTFTVWQACAEQYEARLKVAEDAIKYAQQNISWAEGKRRYHEQNKYYSEALNKIRGE